MALFQHRCLLPSTNYLQCFFHRSNFSPPRHRCANAFFVSLISHARQSFRISCDKIISPLECLIWRNGIISFFDRFMLIAHCVIFYIQQVFLLAHCKDNGLYLRTLATGTELHSLKGHKSKVMSKEYSRTEMQLYNCSPPFVTF